MIVREFAKFNIPKVVEIQGNSYTIEPANIDLDKYDEEGACDEYDGKSYVVIDTDEEPRVRILDGIFDENNRRDVFDPHNYSKYIMARFNYGDEAYVDCLYKILSHTNKTGEVYYDYLNKTNIHKVLYKYFFIYL